MGEQATPRGLRQSLSLLIVVLMALASLGSPALAGRKSGKRVERVATEQYMSPALAIMPMHPRGVAICNQGGVVEGNRGCVDFPLRSLRERFVEIEVTDATGLPVPGFLAWGEDPSEWVPFCGKTVKPLPTRGTVATVWLYPYSAINLPFCAGTATTGTVTATFLRRG